MTETPGRVRIGMLGTRHSHAAGKWQALCTNPLVEPVPLPDPDIHWGREGEIETKASAPSAPVKQGGGCKFSNRCPYVMAECRQAPPPLFLTDDDRAVACYLHKAGAPVSGREMAESLARD